MKLIKNLLLSVCLFSASMLSYSAYADNNATNKQNNADILLIQNADEAILKPNKQQPGTYKLILKGVKPYVSYFTDKPNRITGLMPINKFIQEWHKKGQNNLLQNAPNVGLSGTQLHSIFNEKDISLVMVLDSPLYNPDENILTYTATLLAGQKNKIGPRPIKLHNAALFFDDLKVCWSCGGGGF